MKVAKASLVVAAAAAVIAILFLLMERQETSHKPVGSKTPSKPPSAVGFAPVSSQKSKELPNEAGAIKRYRPEPVSEDVRLKVDALVRRLKDVPDEEKMHDPEFSALLQRFVELLEPMDENPRLERAMMSLMSTKGFDLESPGSGPRQAPGVQIPFGRLDEPVGRSWLEAVMSGDRERVADWMVNRFDGASFEFALDPSLQKTSEGVTVTAPPATSKAPEE